MATYKEIKGVTVQTRDEDPTVFVGSWSSGDNLNTGRGQSMGSGSQTAAIVAGGKTPSNTANAEQYDGSSWAEVNDLNTARGGSGGTSGLAPYTATIVFGGEEPSLSAKTEYYNGSSWAVQNDLNTARSYFAGAGSAYTAALAFGGNDSNFANTESWNGSSWTEVNALNTGKGGIAGTGTQTAALKAGGNGSSDLVESWDGTSWTETTEINTGRTYVVGNGTQTSMLIYGGYTTSYTDITESWNGSAWTEVADLATSRGSIGRAGASNTSGLATGGDLPGSPGRSALTEEWSFPSGPHLNEGDLFLSGGTTLKGFGKAAGIPSTSWASGGSLNAGRYRISASNTGGTVSASIVFGGYAPGSPPPNGYFGSTEEYDGTSFTEVNDLSTARSSASGFGSSTSAIMAAGNQGPKAQTELWNGTSWTDVNDVNTGRSQLAGGGISGTAGLIFGGTLPGYSMQSKTETWNGTSWTETGDLNLARDELAGSGVQTAAFAVAGKVKESGGPPTWYQSNTHEQWDGSSWTETTEINTAVSAASAAGHTSSGLKIGGTAGLSPSGQTKTEFWNGSSWTELNDLSTQRQYLAQGSGTGVSNIVAGGYNGSTYGITNNEEWESDNTLSTVTVS